MDSTDANEVEDPAIDGKADGSTGFQLGTYELSPSFDVYWQMTLSEGNKMSLRGGCKPPSDGGVGCFAIIQNNGTFKLTHSGANRYIRLYSDLDNGDLLAKFSYTASTAGVKLVDTDTKKHYSGVRAIDPASPAGVFQADFGTNSLKCAPSGGDPSKYTFAIKGTDIDVTAKNSRDGVYSVDSAKVASGSLKLVLVNDVDGPLSSDTLTISTASLDALANGTATSASGTDTYHEDFDGTTSHFTLKCTL